RGPRAATIAFPRAHSSAGRASRWQREGRRFEPGWVHSAYRPRPCSRFDCRGNVSPATRTRSVMASETKSELVEELSSQSTKAELVELLGSRLKKDEISKVLDDESDGTKEELLKKLESRTKDDLVQAVESRLTKDEIEKAVDAVRDEDEDEDE